MTPARKKASSGPLLSYYGSKFRAAPKYHEPQHDTIIEPFAGGAGYSLRYPWKRVILYDTYEPLCGAWEFLIQSSAQDIINLPLLEPNQKVDNLHICQEAKWLIGFLGE